MQDSVLNNFSELEEESPQRCPLSKAAWATQRHTVLMPWTNSQEQLSLLLLPTFYYLCFSPRESKCSLKCAYTSGSVWKMQVHVCLQPQSIQFTKLRRPICPQSHHPPFVKPRIHPVSDTSAFTSPSLSTIPRE